MRKFIYFILSICLIMTVFITSNCISNAESDYEKVITLKIGSTTMIVNENEKTIDTAPVIIDGRTLLPIRNVIEEMGGSIDWNNEKQQSILKYNSDEIILTINNLQAIVNGSTEYLDTAPVIIDERTFLPIRFIAENFGFDVEWDRTKQTITIRKASVIILDDDNNKILTNDNSNVLIVYFSLNSNSNHNNDIDASTSASLYIGDGQKFGTTELIANMIQENVGGDIFKIETDKEYSADFNTVISEARDERNSSERPIITNKIDNISKYDTIFIGYPVWSMTVPNVILTFLDEYDLSGKTVIPFCTHDGYGEGRSFDVIKQNAEKANVNTSGIAIASEDIINGDITEIENSIRIWTEELGLKINKLSSEQTPINIKIRDITLTGYLNNTSEAKQFKKILPITISMVGFGGREYYGGIDGNITATTNGKLNFENGDITWCPTNDTAAIFYAQTDRPNLTMEVIPIGKVTSDLSAFDKLNNSEEITFELAENKSKEPLIAYFTWAENVDLKNPQNVDTDAVTSASLLPPGNAAKIAGKIQKYTNGDIFSIKVKNLYSGNYDESVERAERELSQNARPEIDGIVENMEDYDVIYLGYPTWIGACPMAVRTFLESYDFAGKTVIPFCVHGTSGVGTSIDDISKIIPNAEIKKEFSVYRPDIDNCETQLYQWIKNSQ